MSTRMIGGIIMTHGDDKGLRLPPNVAPIQVSSTVSELYVCLIVSMTRQPYPDMLTQLHLIGAGIAVLLWLGAPLSADRCGCGADVGFCTVCCSVQVVFVPIVRKETDRPAVNEAVDKLHAALKGAGIRCKVRTYRHLGSCICHPATFAPPFVMCAIPAQGPYPVTSVADLPLRTSEGHSSTGVMMACVGVCVLVACVQVDANDQKTPGWRYNYWELKGVPVRVEVGPRDVESNTCVMARRDVPGETRRPSAGQL